MTIPEAIDYALNYPLTGRVLLLALIANTACWWVAGGITNPTL